MVKAFDRIRNVAHNISFKDLMNLVFSSSKPIDILIQFGQPKAVSCRTITPFFNNFSVMRFASFSEFQVVVIKFAKKCQLYQYIRHNLEKL